MADDQKNTFKEFQSFCEGMPFTKMMRKMMDLDGVGSFCAQMMQKMKEVKKDGSRFDCAEMMRKMMRECSKV